MKLKVLVRTEHGSHLYNLAHTDSDYDFYEVYYYPYQYEPKRKASQQIINQIDTTRVSLDRFTSLCFKGVPQSLETLFSPEECWSDVHNDWYIISHNIKTNLKFHMPEIMDTYHRTSWNFYKDGTDKKIKHAFRLLINASELREACEMNPRLNARQVGELNGLVNSFDRDSLYKQMLYQTFN